MYRETGDKVYKLIYLKYNKKIAFDYCLILKYKSKNVL